VETRIEAKGLHYKELNEQIRKALTDGATRIVVDNVNGHRYVGAGVTSDAEIVLNGVPGNDMACFGNGLRITVHGNAQDAVANTMNAGELVIHGGTADILGYAMRGGRVFVRDNVGYRVGIHMKEYKEIKPILVIGGKAGDFFGEYMAGGDLILLGLGLKPGEALTGDYVGTGMHGGRMFVRGEIPSHNLGKEVARRDITPEEQAYLAGLVHQWAEYFDGNAEAILEVPFTKFVPVNSRPYGLLYAY
jgi:glutamate synthase domain-containing protein 3